MTSSTSLSADGLSSSAGIPFELDDDEVLLDALRLHKKDVISRKRLDVLVQRLQQDAPKNLEEFWSWLVTSTISQEAQHFQSTPLTAAWSTPAPFPSTDSNQSFQQQQQVQIPPVFQSKEEGKNHLHILMTLLYLSEYQAVQLTYLTIEKLVTLEKEDRKEVQSTLLGGLLGSSTFLFHCISVYYTQNAARIRCLTELLRIEQSGASKGEPTSDDKQLSQLCTSSLNTLTRNAAEAETTSTTTNSNPTASSSQPPWLFTMIVARLLLPPPCPTWEALQPLLRKQRMEEATLDVMSEIHDAMSFYHQQQADSLLDCLLAALYQRFFPSTQDTLCLFKALAKLHFFSSTTTPTKASTTRSQRLSYLSGLICMETMGLWRATTAQQQNHSKAEEFTIAATATIADNTNRLKQIAATPENTAISPQTSYPYTSRRRRRRRAASTPITTPVDTSTNINSNNILSTGTNTNETHSWVSNHPLLTGLQDFSNIEAIVSGLKEMASILLISTAQQQSIMCDTSSSAVPTQRYPQSVALLSLGLLLRLASLSFHKNNDNNNNVKTEQEKLLMEELDSLAVQCVQESNDSLGGFDYLIEMIDDLLSFVEGQQDDCDEQETPETISYASIFIEFLSALLLGFYPMFSDPMKLLAPSSSSQLKKEIIIKSNDIQFICQAASTIFFKRPTLCTLFWKDWQDQQFTAMTCLLQTSYLLAEEGVRPQPYKAGTTALCQLSTFITLLSSLCSSSLELTQYATATMLPPSWIELWLDAVVEFQSKPLRQACPISEEDNNLVVKRIDRAFEALKDLASVYPKFLQQALENKISYYVTRIYRICISSLGRISVNATLLMSYLCSAREEEKQSNQTLELPYDNESSIQWTMELLSLLVNNYKTTMTTTILPSRVSTTRSGFGVFTDALLAADSFKSSQDFNRSNEIPFLQYTAILQLIKSLASQLEPIVVQSLQGRVKNSLFHDEMDGTKVTHCLSYLEVICDGFFLARTMVTSILRNLDSDLKLSFMVANAALSTIQAIINALFSLMTYKPSSLQQDVTVAAFQALFSILCTLSSPSTGFPTAIGMFATVPVTIGWFRAMHQCYDLFQLRRINDVNSTPMQNDAFFNEIKSGKEFSLDTSLKLYAGELRSDLGRISIAVGGCGDGDQGSYTKWIWKTSNSALRLLQTWADISASKIFTTYYKQMHSCNSSMSSALAADTAADITELTPSTLLCRSVIDDTTRNFLLCLLQQIETRGMASTRHFNFARNRDNATTNRYISGSQVELMLHHKSMLPSEASCIAQLTRYLAPIASSCNEKDIIDDSVQLHVYKLMLVCLPLKTFYSNEKQKTKSATSSVVTFQALHGGVYLQKLLSSALAASKLNDYSSSSAIDRLVSFSTYALDSNEVSLCNSIILGRDWDEEKDTDVSPPQALKAKMGAMLDVLRIADSDELQTDQLSVACSIASFLAMLWVKIRLVTSVDLHKTHEKPVTRETSRNAMERFISMLLLNDDFWGLLMRLITRYTSVNVSSSNHDQVEFYLGKYRDRQNATKRTCLKISLVSSCLRIVTSELQSTRNDNFKGLSSVLHRSLFCDGAGNKMISLHQWTQFFVSSYHEIISNGAESTGLSSLLSFVQVYLSIFCNKEVVNADGIPLVPSTFFPYSQAEDIAFLLSSTMSSWANVSIDQISSSSGNHSAAAVDILLRSSALLAEILVSVLSFCHANLERAYLVNLQEVADACLHLIQLAGAQLFPLAVTHYLGSHHHSAESAEIGFLLRLRFLVAILLLIQSTPVATNVTVSWIKQQKAQETWVGLVDLASDTLHLLHCAHLKGPEVHPIYNFGSFSAHYELLTVSIAILIALLPGNSHCNVVATTPDVYTKKFARSLTRNNCLDVMTRHLVAETGNAYAVLIQYIGQTPHAHSEISPQYHNAIATFVSIVDFVSQLVLMESNCVEVSDISGLLAIIRSMTVNPLIEACCKKWYSWTSDSGSDVCDFRGYIPLQELFYLKNKLFKEDSRKSVLKYPFMKSRGMLMSIKVAKDDEVHKIWIKILLMISSLVRSSRKKMSTGVISDSEKKLLQGSIELAIDVTRCYDYVLLSALWSFDRKDRITKHDEFASAVPPRRFTLNGLSEACACLSLVSELCYHDEKCPSLLKQSSPSLHKALVDASLCTLCNLASFLGSVSAARSLFDLVGQFRALESGNLSVIGRHGVQSKSPTTQQRASLQLLCLHPLLANGVPNARHDAITNSHYVSSKCACMTEIDCQLNSRGIDNFPEENVDNPRSPSGDSFQLYVNNEFTAKIEELAACTVNNALLVILRSHPLSMSFVSFDAMELASEDAARLVKVGTIIAVRPVEVPCCLPRQFAIEYLPHQGGLFRYAQVLGCNAIECKWLVEYLGPCEKNSSASIQDWVSFKRLAGIFDMDNLKPVLAFTPENLKGVVERSESSEPSIGHLLLILQWCKQQAKGRTMRSTEAESLPHVVLQSLAGRASQLLLQEIDLAEKLGIETSDEVATEINSQLLYVFGGDIYDACSFSTTIDEQASLLENLLGKEFWSVLQTKLRYRLDSARQNLHAIRARYERSPVRLVEEKSFQNFKFT